MDLAHFAWWPRDAQCRADKGATHIYARWDGVGTPRDLDTIPYDAAHCVDVRQRYFPTDIKGTPFDNEGRVVDATPDHLAVDVPLPALTDAAFQKILWNYFAGVDEWRTELARGGEPDTTACSAMRGVGRKLHVHQAIVWFVMRIWARAMQAGHPVPKGFLVWHSLGSGKTCTAVGVLDALWSSGRPLYMVTTTENIHNLRQIDARGRDALWGCAQDLFARFRSMSPSTFRARFELMSYYKLSNRLGFRQRDGRVVKSTPAHGFAIKNAVFIMDEIQGIFDPLPQYRAAVSALRTALQDAEDTTIIMLTATPGKDVHELLTLVNILRRPSEGAFETSALPSIDDFKAKLRGMVSYYDASTHPSFFPAVEHRVVSAPMSETQFSKWHEQLRKTNFSRAALEDHLARGDAPQKYASRARKYSNMMYPYRGKDRGSFTRLLQQHGAHTLDKLSRYSSKLTALVHAVLDHPNEKHYVYTAFGAHGIRQIAAALKVQDWTDVTRYVSTTRRATLPGTDGKRFISTGSWNEDVRPAVKAAALAEFNARDNVDGKKIAVFLAHRRFNEGLDFKELRHVHLFEPQISVQAEQQAIGRSTRYCSHATLPPPQRTVTVHHYFSTAPTASMRGEIDVLTSAPAPSVLPVTTTHLTRAERERFRTSAEKSKDDSDAIIRDARTEIDALWERAAIAEALLRDATVHGGGENAWVAPDTGTGTWPRAKEYTRDALERAWGTSSAFVRHLWSTAQDVSDAQVHVSAARANEARLQAVVNALESGFPTIERPSSTLARRKRELKDAQATLQIAQSAVDRLKGATLTPEQLTRALHETLQTTREQIEEIQTRVRSAVAAKERAMTMLEELDDTSAETEDDDVDTREARKHMTDEFVFRMARERKGPMHEYLEALKSVAVDCIAHSQLHRALGVGGTCDSN